jgi:hypothetical protein
VDVLQRVVRLLEVRHLVHVRRADQPAVEIVGPRVIRALDAAGELPGGLVADARAAVAADVVEGADLAGGVARDDDVVAVQLADEVLAGALRLFRSAGVEPHRPEESIELRLQQRRLRVVARRQRPRSLGHHVARLDRDFFHKNS